MNAISRTRVAKSFCQADVANISDLRRLYLPVARSRRRRLRGFSHSFRRPAHPIAVGSGTPGRKPADGTSASSDATASRSTTAQGDAGGEDGDGAAAERTR